MSAITSITQTITMKGKEAVSSPAGWYRQPHSQPRYWDGESWREHYEPGAPTPTTAFPMSTPKRATATPANPPTQRKRATAPTTDTPLTSLTGRDTTPLRHKPGVADLFGWGGLALVVLIGGLAFGLRGAAISVGMFALVVALIALARGRVGWARLGSRAAGGAALAAAMVLITVGAAAAPPSKTGHGAGVAPQTSPVATSQSSAPSVATATPLRPSPTSTPSPDAVSTPTDVPAPSVVPASPSPLATNPTGGVDGNAGTGSTGSTVSPPTAPVPTVTTPAGP